MVFLNTFLSYLLLFLLIVVLCGIAVTLGITLAKKKNAKAAVSEDDSVNAGAVNG